MEVWGCCQKYKNCSNLQVLFPNLFKILLSVWILIRIRFIMTQQLAAPMNPPPRELKGQLVKSKHACWQVTKSFKLNAASFVQYVSVTRDCYNTAYHQWHKEYILIHKK